MTNLINNIWAVEVPEGAENIRVSQLIGTPKLFIDFPGYLWAKKLPPGQWEIVCTSKEATVEQARAIVNIPLPTAFGRSAHDWLNELLTSRGLDLSKNYLLLKKIT